MSTDVDYLPANSEPLDPGIVAALSDPAITMLPLDQVHPWEGNPRKTFDEPGLQELAESITRHGVQQPIVVRPRDAGGYSIVMGERRWRAAGLANLPAIPAIVRERMDDGAALELAIVENVKRQDLSPIEEAQAYRRLQELGLTQQAIAERVNRSQPAVANTIRLLKLPGDVQERIARGELTQGHGLAILAAAGDFPEVASALGERAAALRWTTAQLEHVWEQWETYHQLIAAGAVADRDWHFREECEQCPLGAHRKGLCLKPEHHRQLVAEREAAEKARMDKALEKAKRAGKQLPRLDSLGYGTYESLSEPPSGCSETCEHRGQAVDSLGRVVLICTSPGKYRACKAADTRERNREAQAKAEADLVVALARLDSLGSADQAGTELEWLLGKVQGHGTDDARRKLTRERTGLRDRDATPVERIRLLLEDMARADVSLLSKRDTSYYASGALKMLAALQPVPPQAPSHEPGQGLVREDTLIGEVAELQGELETLRRDVQQALIERNGFQCRALEAEAELDRLRKYVVKVDTERDDLAAALRAGQVPSSPDCGPSWFPSMRRGDVLLVKGEMGKSRYVFEGKVTDSKKGQIIGCHTEGTGMFVWWPERSVIGIVGHVDLDAERDEPPAAPAPAPAEYDLVDGMTLRHRQVGTVMTLRWGPTVEDEAGQTSRLYDLWDEHGLVASGQEPPDVQRLYEPAEGGAE